MKKNVDESGEIKRFWDEYSRIYDEENVSEWDIDVQQIKNTSQLIKAQESWMLVEEPAG